MLRPAAVLLGVTLIAVSIGFNTMRYPVVWEMVGPKQTAVDTPPAAEPAPRPEEPKPPETVSEPTVPREEPKALELTSKPAEPIEVAPAPEVGKQVAAEDVQETDAEVISMPVDHPAEATVEEKTAETPKPLVPVSLASTTEAAGPQAVFGEGIRRLPPVEMSQSLPVSVQAVDGAIPIYPTTGVP